MLTGVVLVALGAAPVNFSHCETEAIDQPLVVGLLDRAARAEPIDVACVGHDLVVLTRGKVSREVQLPAGSPALRGRTIALVLGELAAGRVPAPRVVSHTLSSAKAPDDAGSPTVPPKVPGTLYGDGNPKVPGTLYGDGNPKVPGTLYGDGSPKVPGTLYGDGSPKVPGTLYGDGNPKVPGTLYPDAGAPKVPGTLYGDAGNPKVPGTLYGDAGTPKVTDTLYGDGTAKVPDTLSPDAGELGSPVELALIPSIGVNALVGTPNRNHFVLGLLAARSTWLDGVAFAPVSLVDEVARGLQVGGLMAFDRGALFGVQLSAGVSWTSARAAGLQFGSFTFAGNLAGVQLGAANVTGDAQGVQVGFLNVASKMRGVQLGVVNIASSAAVPIGLINLIEDEPMRFVLRVGSGAFGQGAVRLGGTFLYSFLTAGWTPRSTLRWGGGLGTHVGHGRGWFLEVELSGLSLWTLTTPGSWATQVSIGLEVHVGYQIASRLGIFLGLGTEVIFAPPGLGPGLSLLAFPVTDTRTVAPLATLGVVL